MSQNESLGQKPKYQLKAKIQCLESDWGRLTGRDAGQRPIRRPAVKAETLWGQLVMAESLWRLLAMAGALWRLQLG